MICSQCGNNVAEGAAACPSCGAPQSTGQGANVRVSAVSAEPSGPRMAPSPGMTAPAPGGPYAAGPGGPYAAGPGAPGRAMGPGGTAAPAFNLDLKRLTRNDRIVGGATIVFVISLFLPWFTVSDGVFSASVNGLWHGYMYIALILAVAVLASLVLSAGFEQLPLKLPLGHEQAMLVATAAIFVLTVLSFVFKPAGASDAFASVNWGWAFDLFIGRPPRSPPSSRSACRSCGPVPAADGDPVPAADGQISSGGTRYGRSAGEAGAVAALARRGSLPGRPVSAATVQRGETPR